MIRLRTDFNALSVSDQVWALIDGRSLDEIVQSARLAPGDRVLLFQDDDDFEVEGVLRFGPVTAPAAPDRPQWFFEPDWPTRRDI